MLIVSHKCAGTHLKCIELSRGSGFPDFYIFHRRPDAGPRGLLSYCCSKCVGQRGEWRDPNASTPGVILTITVGGSHPQDTHPSAKCKQLEERKLTALG